MVRHILFLDGAGRGTPYQSSTESRAVAERFAGKAGRVYRTSVSLVRAAGLRHWSRKQLLILLKGKGKGHAAWPSAYEVLQARKLVEQHSEHLLDFEEVATPDVANLCSRVWSR